MVERAKSFQEYTELVRDLGPFLEDWSTIVEMEAPEIPERLKNQSNQDYAKILLLLFQDTDKKAARLDLIAKSARQNFGEKTSQVFEHAVATRQKELNQAIAAIDERLDQLAELEAPSQKTATPSESTPASDEARITQAVAEATAPLLAQIEELKTELAALTGKREEPAAAISPEESFETSGGSNPHLEEEKQAEDSEQLTAPPAENLVTVLGESSGEAPVITMVKAKNSDSQKRLEKVIGFLEKPFQRENIKVWEEALDLADDETRGQLMSWLARQELNLGIVGRIARQLLPKSNPVTLVGSSETTTLPQVETVVADKFETPKDEPQDVESKVQAGIQAIHEGDVVTAERLYREVVAEDPDNELAWLGLTTLLTEPDQVEERANAFRRVFEINPKNEGNILRAQHAGINLVETAQPVVQQTPETPDAAAAAIASAEAASSSLVDDVSSLVRKTRALELKAYPQGSDAESSASAAPSPIVETPSLETTATPGETTLLPPEDMSSLISELGSTQDEVNSAKIPSNLERLASELAALVNKMDTRAEDLDEEERQVVLAMLKTKLAKYKPTIEKYLQKIKK